MDIRPTNINGVSNVYKQNMNAVGAKKPESVNSASNKDVIAISEEGLKHSEYGKTVRAVASEVFQDVPAERISSLRTAIENGTYIISSDRIADSILERISA
jgi:anti-sigma28 factor (negative regulator of flagellin synthesis)